jgi:serine/threonine protein kinase
MESGSLTLSGATLSDRYRLDRELGAGGMATVYLAEDLRHGRQAVKVLRPDLASTLAAERFLREIAIVAPLLHPHILGLIDSGETAETLFYVMPYVDGESLRALLVRDGVPAIPQTIRLLCHVLEALAFAHDRGVVHRDIKPENVLLTAALARAAGPIHALVADFGIARALEAAQDRQSSTLTTLGTTLGTPAYMAPEQVAADPHIDHRADLYAVGVLAYEMLAGSPPFAAPTPHQVMAAHLTRVPAPLAGHGVPAALEQFVMRCLAKDPAERFETAAAALERLEAAGRAASAGGTTTIGEQTRALREHRFVLSEDVCRTLDRSRLDPRIIGESVSYLDNEVPSDVVVCFVHGTGLDQSQSDRYLREVPYRAIAPTLFAFEPARRRRIPLALDDHLAILRALLREVAGGARPRRCVLVGLSSGADVVLRLAARSADDAAPIRGVLSLGCNLSLATCFATRLFARLGADTPDAILQDLQRLGGALRTLDDWINVHAYLVDAIRKLRGDVAAVRQFAIDITEPFVEAASRPAADSPFVHWYRAATERVERVRCVFEEDPVCDEVLAAIRLAHLDAGVLGPRHRADGIQVESGATHFDLFRPEVVYRHLSALVTELSQAPA